MARYKSTSSSLTSLGHYLFILYTISFFFRLPERFPILGAIRFDYVLGASLLALFFISAFTQRQRNITDRISTKAWLIIFIIVYILVTIPLVEWPGSVLRYGLINFFKNIVFFIFASVFISNTSQLKRYIFIYFALLLIIILEPTYLYITQGRLGYTDFSMNIDNAGFERLAGTTNKIGGNPNGLASVVAISIPFIVSYLKYYKSSLIRVFLLISAPLILYALVQTGSRSGLLATITSIFLCSLKGRAKALKIIILLVIAMALWTQLGDIHKQRYLTLIDKNVEGRSGVDGRIDHMRRGLSMFTAKPLIGYGIGTFREANWNIMQRAMASHNLYIGTLVELGVFGFALYFLFIIYTFKDIHQIKKMRKEQPRDDNYYYMILAETLEVILITQLVFSVFAGAPSFYIWFLLGGISTSAVRLLAVHPQEKAHPALAVNTKSYTI